MDNLLEELEKDIWIRLLNGAIKPKNPLQYFALGSNSNGAPRLRTVVLRKTLILDHQIYIYTDIRSQKWDEFLTNSHASALFYDGISKIQILLEGEIQLIWEGKIWEDCWNSTSLKSRRSYMTELPPGTPVDRKWTGLDPEWEEQEPTLIRSNLYKSNFGLLIFQVKTLEFLKLDRLGNYRAQFHYFQDGTRKASWLIP